MAAYGEPGCRELANFASQAVILATSRTCWKDVLDIMIYIYVYINSMYVYIYIYKHVVT